MVGGYATFSFIFDSVAKAQNPSVYDPEFGFFTVPVQADFVDGDRDEMLFCPIRALKEYLGRTEQY